MAKGIKLLAGMFAAATLLTGCGGDWFTSPQTTSDDLEASLNDSISTPEIQSSISTLYDSGNLTEKIAAMSKAKAAAGPYTIHKGDKLEISIQGQTDMTREVAVINDGTLTYLVVGTIQAFGKTLTEVKNEITQGLKGYYQNPVVSILPIETYEKKEMVTILGAVKKPGRILLQNTDTRLLDIVAEAGGLLFADNDATGGEFVANLEKSYVSRNGQKLENVNFEKLIREGDTTYNIPLQMDDVVYLADSQSDPIFVLGEVLKPQSIPTNTRMTLVGVVARASGLTYNADRENVIVIHPISKDRQSVKIVNLAKYFRGTGEGVDFEISNGDIVIIPERKLTTVARYSRYVSDVLGAFSDAYGVGTNIRDIPALTKGTEQAYRNWE